MYTLEASLLQTKRVIGLADEDVNTEGSHAIDDKLKGRKRTLL